MNDQPAPVNPRRSVRAVVLDDDMRILLCRFDIPGPPQRVVWAAPGGGIEPGETPFQALRRELHEEIGLVLNAYPPHIWHQEVAVSWLAPEYDGVVNDYHVVRTAAFRPRGALSDEELAAENIEGFRWWSLAEITAYRGDDLFSPRDLATPLAALIATGVPTETLRLGI